MALLNEFGDRMGGLRSVEEACSETASVFSQRTADITFMLVYIRDPATNTVRRSSRRHSPRRLTRPPPPPPPPKLVLRGASNIARGHPAAVPVIDVSAGAADGFWPVRAAFAAREVVMVHDPATKCGSPLPGARAPAGRGRRAR